MEMEILPRLSGKKLSCWEALLAETGLRPDGTPDSTVLIWEGDTLAAAGSREKNILKYLAVSPAFRGEDLTATLLTHLRQDGFGAGYHHLFLYTKPENRRLFSSLFFYPIMETDQVLLMENRKNGIGQFLDSLPAPDTGKDAGAVVMNCNPFTLGHRYLIETAASRCERLYVFVLSEESPPFTARQRLDLVTEGTKDLKNVTVLPTGPYLISSATFPTYFLKDREGADRVHCELDIAIFARYYAPRFGITRRFVGTEPLSPLTDRYNQSLMEHLPQKGIAVEQIPRLEKEGVPISASAVRALLGTGEQDAVSALVPETTLRFLLNHHYL